MPPAWIPASNPPSLLCARQAADSESTCELQSQKRRPVNERGPLRAGKRTWSFVAQVDPEAQPLSERCPLFGRPGISAEERGGMHQAGEQEDTEVKPIVSS